jgi:hypothetical protein
MAVLDHIIEGTFTSDGNAKLLDIRTDLDSMQVINYTNLGQTAGEGYMFDWQRGMAADTGVQHTRGAAGAVSVSALTSGGFTLLDTSIQTPGAPLAATAITAATPPVVSMASTAGLSNGDTVRVYSSTGMLQIAGMEFTIDTVVANTSVNLAYLPAAGFAAPATAAVLRRIPNDPIFYPRRRFITNITQAAQAIVTLSVTHGYTVGQRLTMVVPSQFGMTQMNGRQVRIVAINTTTNTITIDVDSTAFTAFAFPASAAVPFTFAQTVPFGDAPLTLANVNGDQSVLDGATDNRSILGMKLAAGVNSPAGSNGDVIYWKAFKAERYDT